LAPHLRGGFIKRDVVVTCAQKRALESGSMAQLMIVPIHEKGDAVLVITLHESNVLVGYVTMATLRDAFGQSLAVCDGLLLVESNLLALAPILASKSKDHVPEKGLTPCVEVTFSDIRDISKPCSAQILDLAR
jgi:hypothetical protein